MFQNKLSYYDGIHRHRPLNVKKIQSHEHSHEHLLSDQMLLKLSFWITFLVMFVEIIGGIYANSLALISDGIHMFTHAFALALSLIAMVISTKKATTQKSFGYFRAEVLAAFINGLTIAMSVVWIVYESIVRFITPEIILSETTLLVALVGLAVNIITGLLLYKADRENINIKSAFLHMLTDALSSVAIIVGAIVIYYTQLFVLDTFLALFISGVILKWAWGLIKNALHILLEGSPLDTDEIQVHLMQVFPSIVRVDDIHCWEISHNYYCLTARITLHPFTTEPYNHLLVRLATFLEKEFHIAHTTLQLEQEKSFVASR